MSKKKRKKRARITNRQDKTPKKKTTCRIQTKLLWFMIIDYLLEFQDNDINRVE